MRVSAARQTYRDWDIACLRLVVYPVRCERASRDRLICVRYRYDPQRKKRFKTIELVVAERDWQPSRARFGGDQVVGLRVAYAEVAVRDRVKRAGGRWNPERRVWQLRYDRVVALGLNARIVVDPASSSGCEAPTGEHLHADAGGTST